MMWWGFQPILSHVKRVLPNDVFNCQDYSFRNAWMRMDLWYYDTDGKNELP